MEHGRPGRNRDPSVKFPGQLRHPAPAGRMLGMSITRIATSNLVDVQNSRKKTPAVQIFLAVFGVTAMLLCGVSSADAQTSASGSDAAAASKAGPPPSSVGIFPLSQVHRGLKGTAWTVFEGTVPEPMEVEILGVLRGQRGPGRDLILARLHGEKPEYTGVVAGMSGSPVYIDGKLAGALSYRIGEFSKEPIAGITPIEQMLEVGDMLAPSSSTVATASTGTGSPDFRTPTSTNSDIGHAAPGSGTEFAAMETPLLMSGFHPDAIRVWKERMAGTGLDVVSAGGAISGSSSGSASESAQSSGEADTAPVVPGSAVSLQLARGDLEIAATCTVTYVDPHKLLACGHPVLQAGPVSLPMTATEVVATLPSPLNAFKIVNTGRTIGAFTQDRDSAIGGVLGATAHMIPLTMSVAGRGDAAGIQRHISVLDLPSMTANVVLVSIYEALLETNQSTAETSYHVTGTIRVKGQQPVPVDAWGAPGEQMPAQLAAAFAVADGFNRLYTNASRQAPMEGVDLKIEAVPEDMRTVLEGVRLVSSSIVHAGDTVMLEATVRPWEQPARNLRVPFTVPARMEPGNLRLLVGNGPSLDRVLDAARLATHPANESAVSARLRGMHRADRLYVSLLLPETQATLEGQTLDSLPLSMANTLESPRTGLDVGLHGESVVVAADVPAGGVLSGQQLLTIRVESGGGLH